MKLIEARRRDMGNQFYLGELRRLVGFKVKKPTTDKEGEFFGLLLEHPATGQEKVLWILRDDEGNGPGSFEIADA